VCGASAFATTPECTSLVSVACVSGALACTFPAGVCPGGCSANDEICDTLDNDCDGAVNENVGNWSDPCASDDGLPVSHGPCRTFGTYVCSGPATTACSAVAASCATLPGGCDEQCDGVDNDCDGSIDEAFVAKGANATFFVKPTVTKVSATRWIFSYEASRPGADAIDPGTGNGYHCVGSGGSCSPATPAGISPDATLACSAAGRLPWTGVTAVEAEQTCLAMGGFLCGRGDYQTACTPDAACQWGYNPRGTFPVGCASSYTASKFCNLGPSFDFSTTLPGDQDGLLPTASASLLNCWADWSGLLGNVAGTNRIYDLTGNARELTREAAADYRVMGGGFRTDGELGATCGFVSSTADVTTFDDDLGFRCCFSADPTL
jgi:hypothetical protein